MQVDAVSIVDALALMGSVTVGILLARLDSITSIHPIHVAHPITVQQSFALLERIAKLEPIAVAIVVGFTWKRQLEV